MLLSTFSTIVLGDVVFFAYLNLNEEIFEFDIILRQIINIYSKTISPHSFSHFPARDVD